MDQATLKQIAEGVIELDDQLVAAGPQTDDELHAWVLENIGVDIPRTSVCEDHVAPFTFLADLYFERVTSVLLMANRGGAKTFLVAMLHFLNSTFKPGCEGCTFGATEAQSLRAYSHLKSWIMDQEGNKREYIKYSKMRETLWNNGSKVEVLPGTPEAVNGPHPQKAHADEVELMRQDTWDESRNMAIAKRLPDGTYYKAQDILTSTRKGPVGRMQELIDEINRALESGDIPAYTFYAWCVWEVAAEVPNCREADPDEREARLKELGRDPCELCECHRHRSKADWEDGSPRYLNQVCGGKLFYSRGWKPLDDIINTFKQNARTVWEAQQECSKPDVSNFYMGDFSRKKYGIRYYLPDPGNGPIYTSTDWGGSVPHAVHWYQLLRYSVRVMNFDGDEIVLPPDTLIVFNEIYKADISAKSLGRMVHAIEDNYRVRFGDEWEVEARFADPAGKNERMEWAEYQEEYVDEDGNERLRDRPLKTVWKGGGNARDFETHITYVNEICEARMIWVDVDNCPMWCAEAQAWHKDDNGKQVDEFNHAMSNFRYCLHNLRRINRRLQESYKAPAQAAESSSRAATPSPQSPVSYRENNTGEKWRGRFATAMPDQPQRTPPPWPVRR